MSDDNKPVRPANWREELRMSEPRDTVINNPSPAWIERQFALAGSYHAPEWHMSDVDHPTTKETGTVAITVRVPVAVIASGQPIALSWAGNHKRYVDEAKRVAHAANDARWVSRIPRAAAAVKDGAK